MLQLLEVLKTQRKLVYVNNSIFSQKSINKIHKSMDYLLNALGDDFGSCLMLSITTFACICVTANNAKTSQPKVKIILKAIGFLLVSSIVVAFVWLKFSMFYYIICNTLINIPYMLWMRRMKI